MGKAWYCDVCDSHPLHKQHHDKIHGFAVTSDDALFERFSLEIHQAGLSWLTVLKKQQAIKQAFGGFSVKKVAAFTQKDIARLLANPLIIRNRLKINAVIHNAGVIQTLENGFYQWLKSHHPLELPQWVKLFKATFKFCGPEIVNELLMSTGWLAGAHRPQCPIYKKVLATDPPFLWAK